MGRPCICCAAGSSSLPSASGGSGDPSGPSVSGSGSGGGPIDCGACCNNPLGGQNNRCDPNDADSIICPDNDGRCTCLGICSGGSVTSIIDGCTVPNRSECDGYPENECYCTINIGDPCGDLAPSSYCNTR